MLPYTEQRSPNTLPSPCHPFLCAVTQCPILTGEDSRHERSKHEEQHGKKEESRVAEDFLGLVANAQVEQPDEQPDANV